MAPPPPPPLEKEDRDNVAHNLEKLVLERRGIDNALENGIPPAGNGITQLTCQSDAFY